MIFIDQTVFRKYASLSKIRKVHEFFKIDNHASIRLILLKRTSCQQTKITHETNDFLDVKDNSLER